MSLNNNAHSGPPENGRPVQERIFAAIVSILLFGIVAVVYWPACGNGFVEWDDQLYVYEQPRVLQGISLDGIRWALTASVAGNWHPITLISLQLDAQLFGPSPSGFHRTAVLMHALNSVLAFVTIWTLTGCLWRSVICGFLFALHPMRVESVAWISERKDLLSGSFFFLTVLSYIWYVQAPSVARYLRMMVFLALGLSSKPMLVTTPCVLLLLDYWPLGRCRGFGVDDKPMWLSLFREKLALFALSFIASILTLVNQQEGIQTLQNLSLGTRFGNAVLSYATYLSQSFWPVGLSPLYVDHEITWMPLCGAASVLIALTGFAIWQRKHQPYLLVGWLWFVGMLVPVIGLVQAGIQTHADRYMYLSQLGLYLAVVWWVSHLVDRSRIGRIVAMVIAAVFIAGCGYTTTLQIPAWRDTLSLWLRANQVDPSNHFALHHLTKLYVAEGKRDEAIKLITNAVRLCNSSESKNLVSLASLLADQGDQAGAVIALNKALEIHPNQAELFGNRGKAFAALAKWHEAADDYRQAAKLSPKNPSYQFYLAHALARAGDQPAADKIYASAIRQSPEWPQNAAKLAWKMSTNPDPDSRIKFWPVQLAEQANEATGKSNAEILDVLAAAYAEAGRFDDAVITADLAIHAAVKLRQPAFASAVSKRRELYLEQKAYRESGSR